MSKLKSKDLMVGNYVFIKSINKISRITHINEKVVGTEILYPVFYNNIEPIPLTKEILEKNFPMQNPLIESKWVKW